ncbi:hypothetical protein M8J76_014663 [Diaphorina citri]|nr:hypothetical protein M8J75_013790 [Diaphorina citri]KAI5722846.1 hypothetical protein M8J76_014663 [Diaphorina citri]
MSKKILRMQDKPSSSLPGQPNKSESSVDPISEVLISSVREIDRETCDLEVPTLEARDETLTLSTNPSEVVPTVDKTVEIVAQNSQQLPLFDLNKIETEIDEQYKPELISILKKYETFFTEGFPTTTVTTGELQIKLVDPNKIVARRPYPLSSTD